MSEWTDREVRNEARSRDRNDWMEDIREALAGDPGAIETYVCECGDGKCRANIGLTRVEYEAVRAYATRFAIATDHENPEIDQIVSEGTRFSVIQKIAGRPAKIARQTSARYRAS
jgi:hypothetical protein